MVFDDPKKDDLKADDTAPEDERILEAGDYKTPTDFPIPGETEGVPESEQ